MSEQRPPAGSGHRKDDDVPMVGEVVQKTSRFSREVVATMISLATAAFGFVAALAWNTAITESFNKAFAEGQQTQAELSALYIYAVVVTVVGVIVIVLLGRLAARIRTEPIEFKYPGIPRT
ncbi:MAG: DUF5654 family protein [Actinomycetota bacterium]|nr:DUF5654 family protein [Actinomycetota bacterium]